MTDVTQLNFSAAANAGREMKVKHPVSRTEMLHKGTPITVTLLGKDSDAWVKREHASRDTTVESRIEGAKFSSAASEEEMIEALVDVTTSWTAIPLCWVDPSAMNAEGKPDDSIVAFSKDAARKLYKNVGVRWLREQVDKFIGDRANFLPD